MSAKQKTIKKWRTFGHGPAEGLCQGLGRREVVGMSRAAIARLSGLSCAGGSCAG